MFGFLTRGKVLIIIAFIIVGLLAGVVYQAQSASRADFLSSWFQTLTLPFITAVDFASEEIASVWLGYIYLIDLREENKALTDRLAALELENASLREMSANYERLSSLLGIKPVEGQRRIFARVIGRLSDAYSDTLIIDKGSEDGVRRNQGVVTNRGIVGKIISVEASQAKIQLISDIRSKMPALIQRTRDRGLLTGVSNEKTELRLVPRDAELWIGDLVVASGLLGIFPKGFPVGRVTAIDKAPFGLFQTVKIETRVVFSRLEEVFVIGFEETRRPPNFSVSSPKP